jgi:hypothetical protein
MKTSRYIQNFCTAASHAWPARCKNPIRAKSLLFMKKQKMNNHQHLGRKLDDSLPDFEGIVVRGFWKC